MDLLKILDTAPEPAIVDARTMGVSGDTSGDYWLPAPMCLYQKELSDQIVSLHYSDILKYFETKDYKEDVVMHSMQTMCLNSEYVATHPYLLIDHFMPKSLITKDIPSHLAETSGKFAVLRDLMNFVQEYETDTAIVCRPGRTMDLLEALLFGNKVNIKRYHGSSIKPKQKPRKFSCTCHLFPSDSIDQTKIPLDNNIRFDMLVCLDTTIDINKAHIQSILHQQRPRRGSTSTAPVVRLTTINSIDHCELFFGKHLDKASREYLVNVTAAVVVLRDVVGTLPPDLRPIYSQNLEYLVGWLEDPSIPWPLPDVYPIKTYTPMDVERSLLTEVCYTQTNNTLEEAFHNGKKRGRKSGSNYPKDNGPISYYQMKRLKNDYSTNPLKQDMAQLTGITSTNRSENDDYHLYGGILTHKLIQSIGVIYSDLNRQQSELDHFESVEAIQKDHEELHTREFEDIKSEFDKAVNKKERNEEEIKRLMSFSDIKRQENEYLTQEIENILKSLDGKGPDHTALKETLVDIINVQEEIDREKRLATSRDTEKTYMESEIERAKKAIEGEKEHEQIIKESDELKNRIKDSFSKDIDEYSSVTKGTEKLKTELDDEERNIDLLQKKIFNITQQLGKIQTPRIRSSNNNNRSKQRGTMHA